MNDRLARHTMKPNPSLVLLRVTDQSVATDPQCHYCKMPQCSADGKVTVHLCTECQAFSVPS